MAEKRYSTCSSSGYNDGWSSAERIVPVCSNCERLIYENFMLQNAHKRQVVSRDEEIRRLKSILHATEEKWRKSFYALEWQNDSMQQELQKKNKALQRDAYFHEFHEKELKEYIADLNKTIDSMGDEIKEHKEKIKRDGQRIKSFELSVGTWKCRCVEAEKQSDEMNQQLLKLREMVSNAFLKSRVRAEVIHPVVVNDIEPCERNVSLWLDFLRPLGMARDCVPVGELSRVDARWNVHQVILAWLRGTGTRPKTWGTLLSAMHRGSRDLQVIAKRTEYKLLEGLSCPLDFQLCPACRKEFDVTSEGSVSSPASSSERLQLPIQAEGSDRDLPSHNTSLASTLV